MSPKQACTVSSAEQSPQDAGRVWKWRPTGRKSDSHVRQSEEEHCQLSHKAAAAHLEDKGPSPGLLFKGKFKLC